MKPKIAIIFYVLISSVSFAAEPLKCHVGPIQIELAGGKWQVTSCDDGRSLVFVTMKDNPAMPFVFIVQRNGETSKINGEGNGSKEYTSAAFEELKAMTETHFNELVQATLESAKP